MKKFFGALIVGTLTLGTFSTVVSAETESELEKKRMEEAYEAQKQAAEHAREAQKDAAENAYEAQKKADEQVREMRKDAAEDAHESQKKASEQVREAEKKKMELEKEVKKLEREDDDDEDEGDHHRSAVAKFVRKLHEIASSTPGGIGEQVREVARAQNESKDETAEKLKELESRGVFVRFLIGANKDSVNALKSSATTIQNHIDRLNQIKSLTTGDAQKGLGEEIEVLAKEKERMQAIITKNENKSGIFGWLVRFF